MDEDVKKYLEKYPLSVKEMFASIRELIFDRVDCKAEQTLWARLPSYYVGGVFVMLILFKNHINIEAKAVESHKDKLAGYKITPRGMLHIFKTGNSDRHLKKHI